MDIHFIGIGGIGVSALAKYYLAKGCHVSGCDLARSEITDQLKKLGVKIRIGPASAVAKALADKSAGKQTTCSLSDVDEIIYSPAVPKNHSELLQAARYKIQVLSYPQALGELTKTHYTIAISGTHGKSTTTSMIGLLLTKAGFDPTVIVGTKLKEFGDSNCRVGKGKYLVIEADEHFASFLNYRPKIIVLTTIEADHLDYYKNLGNILKTFQKYISLLPKHGLIVANKDDANIRKILPAKNNHFSTAIEKRMRYFSLKQKEASRIRKILKIPGEHNVSNALAALATARTLKIQDKISYQALSRYNGSWRRFEIFPAFVKTSAGKQHPYTLVSDYGHHPTKVRVTIEASRSKWPKKTIWLMYQPHQYARTYYLFKDFVKVLSRLPIEKLILTDIFDVAGREQEEMRGKVSSQKLFESILPKKRRGLEVLYIPSSSPFDELKEYVEKHLRGGEIVIVMGAGNIYNLTVRLTSKHPKSKIKA